MLVTKKKTKSIDLGPGASAGWLDKGKSHRRNGPKLGGCLLGIGILATFQAPSVPPRLTLPQRSQFVRLTSDQLETVHRRGGVREKKRESAKKRWASCFRVERSTRDKSQFDVPGEGHSRGRVNDGYCGTCKCPCMSGIANWALLPLYNLWLAPWYWVAWGQIVPRADQLHGLDENGLDARGDSI